MRIFIFILLSISVIYGQDENSEDVFEIRSNSGGDDDERQQLPEMPINIIKEETNEGSDTFETSTEMIEMFNSSELNLKVEPIGKESLFSPITPLDSAIFNFSQKNERKTEEEEEEEAEKELRNETTIQPEVTTTQKLNVITFSSIPIIVDEVVNRRVLKEKENSANKILTTSSSPIEVNSDPSEIDESETPFDQSALEGVFEQDGSVIDTFLATNTPAFPILKMAEESPKIISNIPIFSTTENIEINEKMKKNEEEKEEEKEEKEEDKKEAKELEINQTETTTIQSTKSSEILQSSLELSTTTTENESTTTKTTSEEEEEEEEEKHSKSSETINEEISNLPTSFHNSSKVFLPTKSVRTPISMRILSIDYSDEFSDLQSGPSKKLRKSITPAIGEYVSSIVGQENLVKIEIKSFTKGSVIVSADILTKKSLGDIQLAVNLLEAAISRNSSHLSQYIIDPLSITIDGISSQAYIDSISTQTTSTSLSSLMIIIIGFSVFIIIGIALLVIFMTTKKRRNSTMKLSFEDSIRTMTPETNDPPHSVHLMSYGSNRQKSSTPESITKTQIDETVSPIY